MQANVFLTLSLPAGFAVEIVGLDRLSVEREAQGENRRHRPRIPVAVGLATAFAGPGRTLDFASPGLPPCDAACCIKSSSSFQNSILPGILLTV
jgi:hypothetical protein